MTEKKSLGSAIDEVLVALQGLNENERLIAVTAVCATLGISLGSAQSAGLRQTEKDASRQEHEQKDHQRRVVDIRTLKDQKNPRTAAEMACIVAYYLQEVAPEGERSETINGTLVEKYFKQAGFRLPKHIHQLLVDAKASGYFDSAGRAAYKLNPVGYNLVTHALPRQSRG